MRDDAERHQFALERELRGHGRGLLENPRIAHHVVRGSDQQHRVGIVLLRLQGGERHRGRGVAADGLEEDGGRAHRQRADLLGHREPVRLIAHDHRVAGALDSRKPEGGLLQHGLLAGQRQELLGVHLAGQGPKAGAGAPGENDGSQFHRAHPGRLPRPIA